MLSKDLTLTISNESDGLTLVIKTVSSLGSGKVFIQGDPGVYDINEVQKALEEVKIFHYVQKAEILDNKMLKEASRFQDSEMLEEYNVGE